MYSVFFLLRTGEEHSNSGLGLRRADVTPIRTYLAVSDTLGVLHRIEHLSDLSTLQTGFTGVIR